MRYRFLNIVFLILTFNITFSFGQKFETTNCCTDSSVIDHNDKLIKYYQKYFSLKPEERCNFLQKNFNKELNFYHFFNINNDLKILSDTSVDFMNASDLSSLDNTFFNINDSMVKVDVDLIKMHIKNNNRLSYHKTGDTYVSDNLKCEGRIIQYYCQQSVIDRVKFIGKFYLYIPQDLHKIFKNDLDIILDCSSPTFIFDKKFDKTNFNKAIRLWKKKYIKINKPKR